MRIIDAHVHCGDNKETKRYSRAEVRRDLNDACAQGAVIFAFPEDMYRTVDSKDARIRANQYVLEVGKTEEGINPFYFVWNDYIVPDNLPEYAGIKWHRHWDEPRYDYDDPKCEEILVEIRKLDMPVTLEEEYEPTVQFVERNPELKVIIPHAGSLNGGCERMNVFFDNPNVYFDTATAPLEDIQHILDNVGVERMMFGSDVSGTREPFFNFPKVELEKLSGLDLDEESRGLLLGGNIEKIVRK